MKIKRQELLDALTAIRPGLARKAILEQTMDFIFTREEVLAYNDKICISHPFRTDFECSIPAEQMYKVLASMSQKELELTYKGGNLLLKEGKMSAKLVATKGIPSIVEKLGLEDLENKWKELPKDFLEGLFLCMFSASQDMSQPYLTCICVDQNIMTSSDELRISQYMLEETDFKDTFLIPAKSVEELVRFKVVEYYLGKAWVYFRTKEGVIFCSRIISGEYPDCTSYFEFEGVRLYLPSELKDSVETALIMADGAFDIDKRIEVNISDGMIECLGENEMGWVKKIVKMKSKKKEVSFSINPIFFSEILSRTKVMICGTEKALFQTDKFKHLILLY